MPFPIIHRFCDGRFGLLASAPKLGVIGMKALDFVQAFVNQGPAGKVIVINPLPIFSQLRDSFFSHGLNY